MRELSVLLRWQAALTPAEWSVLTQLCSPHRRHGILASGSSRELAVATGLCRRTIQRAIDRLNDLGLIVSTTARRNAPTDHSVTCLLSASEEPVRGDISTPVPGDISTPVRGDMAAPVRGDIFAPAKAAPAGIATPTGPKRGDMARLVRGDITAPVPQSPYKERARVTSLTHSVVFSSEIKTRLRVSEWADGIRGTLLGSFGFAVAPRDPLLYEFEKLTRELGLDLPDLLRWLATKAAEKRRHYTRSAGAVLVWAQRGDLRNWALPRKPMAREVIPATADPQTPNEEAAEIEALLQACPAHVQASAFRERLQYLRTSRAHAYAAATGR